MELVVVYTRKCWHLRTTRGRTGALTGEAIHRIDAYRMIRRRAAEASSSRSSVATSSAQNAQAMAAHESPRTTKLYDRTGDEITLDEVERVAI